MGSTQTRKNVPSEKRKTFLQHDVSISIGVKYKKVMVFSKRYPVKGDFSEKFWEIRHDISSGKYDMKFRLRPAFACISWSKIYIKRFPQRKHIKQEHKTRFKGSNQTISSGR